MCVNSGGVWGIMLVKPQVILAEFLHFSSYREGLGWLLKLDEETLSFEWTPGKSMGSAFAWTEYLILSMLCQKFEISWKHRWSIFGHRHQQDDRVAGSGGCPISSPGFTTSWRWGCIVISPLCMSQCSFEYLWSPRLTPCVKFQHLSAKRTKPLSFREQLNIYERFLVS